MVVLSLGIIKCLFNTVGVRSILRLRSKLALAYLPVAACVAVIVTVPAAS